MNEKALMTLQYPRRISNKESVLKQQKDLLFELAVEISNAYRSPDQHTDKYKRGQTFLMKNIARQFLHASDLDLPHGSTPEQRRTALVDVLAKFPQELDRLSKNYSRVYSPESAKDLEERGVFDQTEITAYTRYVERANEMLSTPVQDSGEYLNPRFIPALANAAVRKEYFAEHDDVVKHVRRRKTKAMVLDFNRSNDQNPEHSL